jgi:uncharacterized protein YkwD
MLRSVLVIVSTLGVPFVSSADGRESDERTAAALLKAHNQEREKQGLKSLKLARKLVVAAEAHARDLAEHHHLDHKGTDGSTVVERVKRQGYTYVRVGENIADGQVSVDKVMKVWMESQGHRDNVLGDYSEMGGASAVDDRGRRYWCVVFAASMPRLEPALAAKDVVTAINEARKRRGRPALRVIPTLEKGAMAVSSAMAAKNSLKTDKDPFRVLADHGAETRGRELKLSLESSVPTAEEAAKTLVGDEAGEIDQFGEIGVGYAIANDGTPYWCAVFSRLAPPEPRQRRSPEPPDR